MLNGEGAHCSPYQTHHWLPVRSKMSELLHAVNHLPLIKNFQLDSSYHICTLYIPVLKPNRSVFHVTAKWYIIFKIEDTFIMDARDVSNKWLNRKNGHNVSWCNLTQTAQRKMLLARLDSDLKNVGRWRRGKKNPNRLQKTEVEKVYIQVQKKTNFTRGKTKGRGAATRTQWKWCRGEGGSTQGRRGWSGPGETRCQADTDVIDQRHWRFDRCLRKTLASLEHTHTDTHKYIYIHTYICFLIWLCL